MRARSNPATRPAQEGFALIAAVFVLLILAALSAFAFRVGTNQQQTATFDLLIARARAAAESGLEYGANRALRASQCLPTTTLTLAAPSLNGFSVTVTCSVSPHQIGATTYHAYALQSVAQRGTYGSPDFVARTVSRTVNDAP